jgi:hypothetical protein
MRTPLVIDVSREGLRKNPLRLGRILTAADQLERPIKRWINANGMSYAQATHIDGVLVGITCLMQDPGLLRIERGQMVLARRITIVADLDSGSLEATASIEKIKFRKKDGRARVTAELLAPPASLNTENVLQELDRLRRWLVGDHDLSKRRPKLRISWPDERWWPSVRA